MYNFGDIELNKIVYIPFNTFDSTGASVTVTDLVAGDINIYKNGGTTKRSSSAGVTVSVDFASITGGHLIAIDTSDNTDAGFYADGADYQVRLEGITVATKTLNPFIATFSIRNRSALMPTTAGRKLDVESTGEAGLDFNNIKDASSAKTLTNITVPTVSTLTNAPASNSDITSIKTQTDKMAFTTANQIDARVITNSDKTGYTASTVSDKTGYSLSGTKQTLDALNDLSESDITTAIADLPTNAELTAALGTLNDITVADIIAGISDGTFDLQELIKIFTAACAGKSSGGGTATLIFRNPADTKNRITATVDANGNRTAMVYDLT